MYSSVWNCVISYLEAGFARCCVLAEMHAGLNQGSAYVNLHLGVQAIVHDQAMRHAYAVGLHGMSCYIGIVADVGVVEVGDLFWLRRDAVVQRSGARRGRHVGGSHIFVGCAQLCDCGGLW